MVAQTVKRLSAMQETRVRSLGWEDSLEKEMATHSSTLAWKIPWRKEPGKARVHGVAKSQTGLSTYACTLVAFYLKDNGTDHLALLFLL